MARADRERRRATYVALVAQLMERYGWVADKVHRRKMAREAARGVLPNATETKIVVTANARAWRTMLELRSSEGAELEIRRCAVAVLRVLQEEAPGFFSDFEIYEADDRREAARIGVPQSLSRDRTDRARIFVARRYFSLREKIAASVFCAATSSRWRVSCAPARQLSSRARARELSSGMLRATTTRDGMTRIGFAYNQKPEPEAPTQRGGAVARRRGAAQ